MEKSRRLRKFVSVTNRRLLMLIESFIKYIRYELNLSTCTVLSYSNDVKQFAAHLTGGKEDEFDAVSVTVNDIREWMVSLVDAGDSVRTVRRKIQSLRAFYKFLLKKGLVKSSPAQDVEVAKAPKRLPDCVRVENVEQLFDGEVDYADFDEVRNRLILLMLYSTGIRRAELIDLLDCNVGDTELKVHGKRNKDRIVPIGEELRSEIAEYRKLRDEILPEKSCGNFFVRKNGEPLYASMVYRLVHEKLSEVGGGSRYSPHVLRHTFASAMLNNGAKLNSVKELLGHESLAATQIYTHITYRELKSNYEHAHPRALKKGG